MDFDNPVSRKVKEQHVGDLEQRVSRLEGEVAHLRDKLRDDCDDEDHQDPSTVSKRWMKLATLGQDGSETRATYVSVSGFRHGNDGRIYEMNGYEVRVRHKITGKFSWDTATIVDASQVPLQEFRDDYGCNRGK